MDFSNHALPHSNYISNKETSSFINNYTTFSQNKLLMIKNNEQEMENNNISNNEDIIDIQNFYESQQQCLEDKLISRFITMTDLEEVTHSFLQSQTDYQDNQGFSLKALNSNGTDFYMLPGKCTLLNVGSNYISSETVVKGFVWVGVFPIGSTQPVFGWKEFFDARNLSPDGNYKINTFWDGIAYSGQYLPPNNYKIKVINLIKSYIYL